MLTALLRKFVLALCVVASAAASTASDASAAARTGGKPRHAGIDYYVSPNGHDSSNGSAAAPWGTIQQAASRAKPGATVHVAPGTYYEAITSAVAGTADARIRFVSDVKWGAKIVAPDVEAAWMNRGTGNYIDIEGFDIRGRAWNGIENNGSFVRMTGNHVHDLPTQCNSNGGAGINNANYAATDNDIVGNVVHNIGPPPGCAQSHGHGIYHSTLRGHIYNNLSYRNGICGIHLWHAANAVIISNNTVFANQKCGIVVGAGDAPGGVVNDNTIVTNNLVVYNGTYGIQEFGDTGTHNAYKNNLVYQNKLGNIALQNGLAPMQTVTADPQFVSYQPDGHGDYHLKPTSPALRAGTSLFAPKTDLEFRDRPTGGAVDIGAYEFGTMPARWKPN